MTTDEIRRALLDKAIKFEAIAESKRLGSAYLNGYHNAISDILSAPYGFRDGLIAILSKAFDALGKANAELKNAKQEKGGEE